jgi:hypothetical protein
LLRWSHKIFFIGKPSYKLSLIIVHNSCNSPKIREWTKAPSTLSFNTLGGGWHHTCVFCLGGTKTTWFAWRNSLYHAIRFNGLKHTVKLGKWYWHFE